jgi:hypothetical protein
LDKNKKFVVFNPAAYLTSPNKPKIQYVDREKIKGFCDIAMEFLVNDETYTGEEAMEEYKRCSENQDKLASFDSFPGVADFIRDVLKADKAIITEAWQ